MKKTNKELAVDVAIAVIQAHPKQIVFANNGSSRETTTVGVEEINEIILSVYANLESLDSN